MHPAEPAVAPPSGRMGAKISVDSATMANKGLEAIEAAYLFNMPADRIAVVVHPESIVHSLVEYIDGSTLAQLGPPDMKTPIAYALAWPDRIAWNAPRLDLAAMGRLTFEAPDEDRYAKLVVRGDRLIGALLIGYGPDAAHVTDAVKSGRSVAAVLPDLRRGTFAALA